jgi:cytochrome c oxidase subunit 2
MFGLLPEVASSFAGDIDNVIMWITIIVGVWFILAEGVFFYFLFKFRKKDGQKALYLTGETKEEMRWISVPHALVLICDVVILAMAISVWYTVKQSLPPADDTIRIVGQQWSWRFVHSGPDGQQGTADDIETVDELHVEVGKTYHFQLESMDVNHSFSVPVFRLKQDAIPGRVITGWFKPTKTGEFDIQCAEMCGIGHGIMNGRIFIQSAEELKNWIASRHG